MAQSDRTMVIILNLQAALVRAILENDYLTPEDVQAARKLTALAEYVPDYIGAIAGANAERLADGYVLATARELLNDSIEGV